MAGRGYLRLEPNRVSIPGAYREPKQDAGTDPGKTIPACLWWAFLFEKRGGGVAKGKITPKQKRFADEYLIDLNATQAAKRAGYSDPNFGRQLITKPNVAAYIQQKQARLQKKTDITQERVLAELAKIGFANITDYLEYKMVDNWPSINVKDSSEVDASSIQEVSIGKDGTFKFKMYSKLDALEKLARHLGLYTLDADAEKETLEKARSLLGGVDSAF